MQNITDNFVSVESVRHFQCFVVPVEMIAFIVYWGGRGWIGGVANIVGVHHCAQNCMSFIT